MKHLLLALQFLTSIPVKVNSIKDEDIAESMAYFPLIGLFLGGILTAANNLMIICSFNPLLSSVILVVLLIILTAGIHLDGAADTFDALLSGKPKDEMLKIMRDSHIGVMGVLSLICILSLKIALIYSISAAFQATALILMCVLSRWCMVFSTFFFPYARKEGKAMLFMQGMNIKIFTLALISVLAFMCAFWGMKSLFVLGVLVLCSYLTARAINKKIGGLTGDNLGAISESAEVIVLFFVYIIEMAHVWIM